MGQLNGKMVELCFFPVGRNLERQLFKLLAGVLFKGELLDVLVHGIRRIDFL